MTNLILFLLFGLSLPLGSAFFGNATVRLFKAESMRIPLACRIGLGLILLTFLLILLGVLHLYTPTTMWFVFTIWLMASFAGYRQVRKEPFFTETFPFGDPTWNPLFLRIGVAVMLLICLLNAMTPETRHDPYDYHLTIPTIYLSYGKIVEIPWHVFAYMPKNCEILYGMALGIGNDSLTKLTHFLFGCLCVLCVSSWIKRIAGHEASMLAGLLVVTLPIFGFLATLSYIDLGRAFWELAALYMLYQAWEESPRRTQSYSIVMSGLFAGMALGCKYVSFLVFLPPYLVLIVLTFWKRIGSSSVRLVPIWFIALILPIFPWMIYNLIWSGNPIYPLLPSLFGMNIPSAETAYEFIRNHAPQPAHLNAFALPGYILSRINGLLLDGNALTLIGIVALLTSSWWRKQSIGESLPSFALRGLVIYILLSSILFLVGSDNVDGRFFVSTLMLLAVPVTFFLYAISNSIRQSSPWGKYVIPGFALILFANAVTYRFDQITVLQESPLPIVTDTQRDRWLNHRFTYYKVAQWANENLQKDSLVLGMGYPLRRRHIARIKYGYIPFLENNADKLGPKELAKRLYEYGVTHIVKPYIHIDPPIDFSILEAKYLKLLFSHRGIQIYELLPYDSYESN